MRMNFPILCDFKVQNKSLSKHPNISVESQQESWSWSAARVRLDDRTFFCIRSATIIPFMLYYYIPMYFCVKTNEPS